MMVLTLGASLVASSPARAATWDWENPLPQGNTLQSILVQDAFTAVAVGNRGTVVRTQDGGQTWQAETGAGGAPEDFFGIASSASGAFGDPGKRAGDLVYVRVGQNGRVQVSFGDDWSDTPAQPPTDSPLRDVDATSILGETFWVVGDSGKVFKTLDEGESWLDISTPNTLDINTVHSSNNEIAVVAGEGGLLLITTDCGQSWIDASSGKRQVGTATLRGLDFADDLLGKAVGDQGTILGSTDGGASWTPETSGTTSSLRSVAHLGGSSWMAVGTGGTARRTTDGGTSWSGVPTGTTATLRTVDGAGNTVFAVGDGGMTLRSTDGGASFAIFSSGLNSVLLAISHKDEQVGIAVGSSGVVLQTLDGGASWTQKSSGTTQSLNKVAFEPAAGASLGAADAWAVGGAGTILRSTDDGESWQSQSSGTTQPLNAVESPAQDVLFAAGNSGVILHSTDGGLAWEAQTSGVTANLLDGDAVDGQTVWFVGTSGTILHTTDGGQVWAPQASGTSNRLNGVDFTDALTGTAVGASGTIRRTTDGGTTWSDQSFDPTTTYTGVAFLDENTGVIVGSGTLNVLVTQDGGETWTAEVAGSSTLFGVAITSSGIARAVGVGGAIVTRLLTSLTVVDDRRVVMASGVVLDQNYPNPVSRATRFGFELRRPALVTLVVYNVSGQRVATLLEGPRTAGRHEESVDLSRLADGVYLYRLTADGESRGRRLIVVR
jgi:photosystem II stability/assembly factor-like uncharacterized protein